MNLEMKERHRHELEAAESALSSGGDTEETRLIGDKTDSGGDGGGEGEGDVTGVAEGLSEMSVEDREKEKRDQKRAKAQRKREKLREKVRWGVFRCALVVLQRKESSFSVGLRSRPRLLCPVCALFTTHFGTEFYYRVVTDCYGATGVVGLK